MIEKINASRTRMEEVEVFGIPALFTPHRVSRATVHLELFCYEIQAGSTSTGTPFRLMEEVPDSFYGTVITPVPVELPKGGVRTIEPGDYASGLNVGSYTPAEFEIKYLVPSPEQQREKEWYE